jgi:hypothetical protein
VVETEAVYELAADVREFAFEDYRASGKRAWRDCLAFWVAELRAGGERETAWLVLEQARNDARLIDERTAAFAYTARLDEMGAYSFYLYAVDRPGMLESEPVTCMLYDAGIGLPPQDDGGAV